MQNRILVLSAPFGSGHLQAARAIAAACGEMDPNCQADVVSVDGSLMGLVSSGYLKLVGLAPYAYRSLYRAPVGSGTRRFIRTALAGRVRRAIDTLDPTAVVATHPFPGAVAAFLRRQGLLRAPVIMALTDFLPHPLWLQEGVDCYCAASDLAARRLRELGAPSDRIAITGIPVGPEFGAPVLMGAAAPFPPMRVLVMGGGLGLGPVVQAVRSLAALPARELRVTVVAGHNESLRLHLAELLRHDQRFTVLGYTREVPALMAGADLLVTKPGGITCAEALAMSLPMLLLNPLPGHEEENATYLCGTGAALVTGAAAVGERTAHLLLEAPERLAWMREMARLSGRPDAARSVANQIFIRSTQNHHRGATA